MLLDALCGGGKRQSTIVILLKVVKFGTEIVPPWFGKRMMWTSLLRVWFFFFGQEVEYHHNGSYIQMDRLLLVFSPLPWLTLLFLSCSSSSRLSFLLCLMFLTFIFERFCLESFPQQRVAWQLLSNLPPPPDRRIKSCLDQTRCKVARLILCWLTVSPWQPALPAGVLWDEWKRIIVNSLRADIPVLMRLLCWLVNRRF